VPAAETVGGKGAGSPAAGRPVALYSTLASAALAVLVVDQVTKELAASRLADGPIDLFGGAVTLRLTLNSGGAFGLLQGLPGLFLIATAVVVVVILLWVRRLDDGRWAVPLGMVLGGGLGNVFDRIFRDTSGQVVDFIDLHWWPVFNLADASIVVGVAIVMFLSLSRSHRGEG
jgi:signal peptidase II